MVGVASTSNATTPETLSVASGTESWPEFATSLPTNWVGEPEGIVAGASVGGAEKGITEDHQDFVVVGGLEGRSLVGGSSMISIDRTDSGWSPKPDASLASINEDRGMSEEIPTSDNCESFVGMSSIGDGTEEDGGEVAIGIELGSFEFIAGMLATSDDSNGEVCG